MSHEIFEYRIGTAIGCRNTGTGTANEDFMTSFPACKIISLSNPYINDFKYDKATHAIPFFCWSSVFLHMFHCLLRRAPIRSGCIDSQTTWYYRVVAGFTRTLLVTN